MPCDFQSRVLCGIVSDFGIVLDDRRMRGCLQLVSPLYNITFKPPADDLISTSCKPAPHFQSGCKDVSQTFLAEEVGRKRAEGMVTVNTSDVQLE